jgi:hypothetical protein
VPTACLHALCQQADLHVDDELATVNIRRAVDKERAALGLFPSVTITPSPWPGLRSSAVMPAEQQDDEAGPGPLVDVPSGTAVAGRAGQTGGRGRERPRAATPQVPQHRQRAISQISPATPL